ncbi:hypothetical protein BFP72_06480 [Reichenbachiella sp. 5M10]|uniref:ComEA family DNA-binding protein n=1 Tax=Reichenbachiella sp. 5M10 TaxID=1889772 RepID=UPI000C14E3BE|nr:helix-hairpin-helix domain-containing protein [Reichenbachiella sp. 5M10]PIB35067.1 hypothetical protein BFP72_06480 [Reichenbachiella sp. 5M10]
MIRWFFIGSLCFVGHTLAGQEPKRPEIDIQNFIETMFQVPDQDINYEDLYESLYQLYLDPIDLNRATKTELSRLYQLDLRQINELMNYLNRHGPMLSLYELQVIDGFDKRTINNIRPFVVVRSPGDYHMQGRLVQRVAKNENTYLLLRARRTVENKKGYQRVDPGRYMGSPYQIYGRFLSRHSKDYSLGLTFEKDPGEKIYWNHQQHSYGFDYYSYHLFLENKGKFKRISLGDYQAQFGQGLILGAGFNPGKGAETITTVKRGNSGIRPYSSVLETGFMRGAAFTYAISRQIDISPFISRMRQDANTVSVTDTDEPEEYISSILSTGLHRTRTEWNKRKQITETTYGINLTYNAPGRNFQGGLTYLASHYSIPIQRTPTLYNQFEFNGKHNYNLGIFANYNWHNMLLFGEAALSRSGGQAYIAGLMSSLTPELSLSLVYRDYAKDYHTFYGNGFGEGARTINEKGIYWGLKYTPSRRWLITAYYDWFLFPWLKYRAEAPTSGYEFLTKISYSPSRSTKLYLQYRQQSKERTVSQENMNVKKIVSGVKRSVAGNLDFQVHPNIGLKSRVQFSTFDQDGQQSTGVSIMQDLTIQIAKLKVSTRFAVFDTEDYENRQYVYEKDLLYAFSIPAYTGQGTRTYILLQYSPVRKITLWAKYGRYLYDNQTTSIGSSNEQIIGNTQSEIKFQIRYKL